MNLVFDIRSGGLSVTTDTGETYVINATSGRGGCQNNPSISCQKSHYEGPIPIGTYSIDPHDLSDPGLLWDAGRRLTGDWGDWRIRVKAYGVAIHGRTNFFIHGGDTYGSAGCIDIGGGILGNAFTDRLKKDILSSKSSIRLEVR